MRWAIVLLAAMACGRLGFGGRAAEDSNSSDVAIADVGIDGPPPRFVQIVAPGFGSAATASATISETAGDLVIAAVYWDESPDTVTLADSAGLGWTALPAQTIPSVCGGTTGNATGAQVYYAAVSATGANTVTVTQTSGLQPLGVMVAEYANVATTPDAQSGQVAPASSHALQAAPLTTTGPGLVLAFFNETQNAGTMTGGSGYTAEALDTAFPNMYEDAFLPAGTYAPDGALPAGQTDACWVAIAIAFRAR